MNKDLIKREDAIKAIKQWRDNDGSLFDVGLNQAIREIKRLPSADRPQGSWKEDYNGGGFKEWLDITCSLCGETLHDIQKLPEDYKYCPFCGARMKGADDEID